MGPFGGLVLTEALVPLDNASVQLLPLGLNSSTDIDGGFAFLKIPWGIYVVLALKEGFLDTTSQVDVGVNGTGVTLILHPIAPSGFQVDYEFDGFLESSANVGVARVSNGTYAVGYDIGPRLPDWIAIQLALQPVQALAPRLNLTAVEFTGATSNKILAAVDGTSPLNLSLPASALATFSAHPEARLMLMVYGGSAVRRFRWISAPR